MLFKDTFEMKVRMSWQGRSDLLSAVAWIRNCEQSPDFAFVSLYVSTVLDGDSELHSLMA